MSASDDGGARVDAKASLHTLAEAASHFQRHGLLSIEPPLQYNLTDASDSSDSASANLGSVADGMLWIYVSS
jgi:hypothetical protein